MTKFNLINQDGAVLKMDGTNGIFVHSVTGLGAANAPKFETVNNGFFTRTDNPHTQGAINCVLYFGGANPYADYKSFSDWLFSAGTMKLEQTVNGVSYYITVMFRSLTRTEFGSDHRSADLSLAAITPWFKPVPVTVAFNDPADQNYFAWGVSELGNAALAPNTSGEFSADVTASGHIDAAVVVTFNGTIAEPVITLKSASETIYGRCALSGTYTGTLVLDTSYGGSMVTVNGVDMINDVNINYEPFFRVPVGESCEIVVESQQFTGTCEAKVYEYYRSV